jgi:hypothetical protein
MRKILVSALSATVMAVGMIGMTATPAAAIEVKPCDETSNYLAIHNERKECFAYAGTMDVHITDVYKIDTGNNLISIWCNSVCWWENGNPVRGFQLNKFETKTFNPRLSIDKIRIV